MKWCVYFKGKNNVEGLVIFFYAPKEKGERVPKIITDFAKTIAKLPGMDKTEIRQEEIT